MATESSGSYADIYEVLCDGKKVTMSFPHESAFIKFKIGLHQYRKAIADTLASLGESTEKETMQLSFDRLDSTENAPVVYAVFYLIPRKKLKFAFTVED